MDRLYELHVKGIVSNLEIFASKEKEISETIARLKGELALCNTDEKETVQKAKALFFVINELEEAYKESNYEDKALIIKEICGISVLKGKKVIPNYQEPFDTLSRISKALKDNPELVTEKLSDNPTTFKKSCTQMFERAQEELNL